MTSKTFCEKCYASLRVVEDSRQCVRCGRVYDTQGEFVSEGVDVLHGVADAEPRELAGGEVYETRRNEDGVYPPKPSPLAPSLETVVKTYIAARTEYEKATAKPNSHARARVLKHGDPIMRRWVDARDALNKAVE